MTKILVVEDTELIRNIVKKTLERYGIKVILSDDGSSALEMYRKESPDMVFMDITMPNMDGIEATKTIVAYDKNAKICMLTALGDKNTVKEAIMAGAKSFIVKPFNNETLLNTIQKMLKIDLIRD